MLERIVVPAVTKGAIAGQDLERGLDLCGQGTIESEQLDQMRRIRGKVSLLTGIAVEVQLRHIRAQAGGLSKILRNLAARSKRR